MAANRIKQKREAAGMKQAALASMTGAAQSEISRIETGECEPGVYLALRIARTLGATVEELFGGTEKE